MGQLPIKLPETAGEKKLAGQIIERVEAIIAAKKGLQHADPKTPLSDGERERLERQVEAHEQAVNDLVCRLYGVAALPA